MARIKLEHAQWDFDPSSRLGPPGGFGEVFAGIGNDGRAVAVKRLFIHAGDAAHRELRIARELVGRTFDHVIPFLDAGQDSDSDRYYVVMPKAEQSLKQYLISQGSVTEEMALAILIEIAGGLLEVLELVHRDLKPANVLMHEGKWKIADFGIAKFVAETTSTQTLRDCLTPPYAAPEQWRGERVTNATDVYAMGCIAYELLTGSPPFKGPQFSDYERQHISDSPPPLPQAQPRLRSFIGMMLRKEPAVRPATRRILEQLAAINLVQPERRGKAALAEVGQRIGEEIAHAEATAAAEKAEQEHRFRVAKAANEVLNQLAQELCETAVAHAPQAGYTYGARGQGNKVHQLSLGRGHLLIEPQAWGEVIKKGKLPRSHWDVIAGAVISAEIPGVYGRSASLWFTNAGTGNEYRWYELWFTLGPHNELLIPHNPGPRERVLWQQRDHFIRNAPFAFAPRAESDAALIQAGTNGIVLASQPQPIDFDSKEAFFDRWHSLFAQAAEGKLNKASVI